MKRLASLVLAAGFAACSLLTMGQRATATPFADVPANHWAYQAIASLAADGLIEGFPDGAFKGDRPLSRYEMAVIVARMVAKVQANGSGYASKTDLDTLQKLIDALKDELDSLGVRVTNVEDALDALDKRTKLAQSLQLHGSLFHSFTQQQNAVFPHAIGNGTGVPQPLYYGGTAAPGGIAGIDPFVDAFIRSPEDNSPLGQAPFGNNIRFDDKISLSYAIDENLTVSLPIHILSYNNGSEFNAGNANIGIQPDILVNVAKTGNLTNVTLRFGQLDNIASSRLGLTYRAPDAAEQGPGFEYPVQPYQTGVQLAATLNGLTDFQVNFSRVDASLLNTQPNILDPNGDAGVNNYLYYTARPQTGYIQPGAPQAASGALRSNTFTAGSGPLAQVYLGAKALIGTVYISQYNGSLFNNAGVLVGGTPGGPPVAPGFVFNDSLNAVVFSSPLPPGSSVTITYVSETGTSSTSPQRYNVNVRVNQKLKGLPGAEIGLSFNRLFDTEDFAPQSDLAAVDAQAAAGFGLVSDTVLGLDAQIPISFLSLGRDRTQHPILYGELASSRFTPDTRTVAGVTDAAGVVGLRLKIAAFTASLQYQNVGANYLDGAPTQYFGNPPQLLGVYNLNYFPGFIGFANNLGINQQFDTVTGACASANKANCTSQNPNLTFIYPVFNPFVASGAEFFSAYAPNAQGETLNLNAPVRLGHLTVNSRVLAQHLGEIRANPTGTQLFSAYAGNGVDVSKKRMTLDKVEAGAQFNVPAFGQSIGINLTGGVEHLSRADKTAFAYVPLNLGTLAPDAPSAALAGSVIGAGSGGVPFYPNYTDIYHTTVAAAASVPISKDVVFGASYNTQGFHGAYGTTLTQNIAERKDTYVGSVTYTIPKTTSSVAFALSNYKYTDYVLPAFNSVVNKEDVNFVIRF